MYTTVLFDADNTLLDFNKDERHALIKVMKYYGADISDENVRTYSKINLGLWKKFEKGEITKDELKKIRFGLFFDEIGFKTDVDSFEINEKYLSLLGEGGQLIDGAEKVCRELFDKGISLYIVTNGVAATQAKRLKQSGISDLFRDVFVSETIGYQKPRKEFFDYVLENISEKDKQKILVVGDSLSSDIKGAMNSGLHSMWLNMENSPLPDEYKPDYVADDISKVLLYV